MPNVFSAVKAIIQKGETFLVVKQLVGDKPIWDLPGGKVDYDEDPYDTLHREVKEETDLDIEIIKPLGMWYFFRRDKDQVVCNTFLCKPLNDNVDITKNPVAENITEFVWVTKEEFLDPEFGIDNESLKKIINLL